MILSDEGIKAALGSGSIEISPRPEADQYTTSAIDLRLGDEFSMWDRDRLETPGVEVNLNLAEQQFQATAKGFLTKVEREPDGCVILPPYGKAPWHILALTREKVHLCHEARLAARVEGRSSFARLGLVVHLTAPTIHAGFRGYITLEIINFGPFFLKLVPNKTRICQLIIERLEGEPRTDLAKAAQFQDQETTSGRGRIV